MKLAIDKLKTNPDNPRLIKDDKYKKLVQSLKDFPEMAEAREIVGFHGYYATSDGRLFSTRYHRPKEVTGSPDQDGYLKVTLVDNMGKPRYKRKHRVIAEAFFGVSELETNHKDRNKTNNAITNLEYVTLRENQCHRRNSNIGVCWAKKEGKWRAYIQHNKKWEHLGFYDNAVDAKNAYIQRAKELNVSLRYAV